jgi:hypothetical protein
MRLRADRIRRATWAAWGALTLGSLAVLPFIADMGVLDLGVTVLVAAVLAAGPAIVNVRPEGSKTLSLATMAGAVGLALLIEPEIEAGTLIVACTLVALLYLASVHRTMRAALVPLAVLWTGVLLGSALALLALTPAQCLGEGDEWPAADWALIGGVLALAAGAFVLAMWSSGRVNDGLARLVRRGWLSDTSMATGAGMLVIVTALVVATDAPAATPGVQSGLWLGWTALIIGAYVWALHRQRCPRKGRVLLMLRVFSRDRKAERLLDALQARWQLAGPVLEIGGPDLVLLNLGSEEFIHFATFRLHELFQPAAVPHELLARSLDLGLDREGRFRVNEVFCFDTSWKAVVEQLLSLADVVLLDLRSFDRQREGTTHEVERLAERGLLASVVALGNRDTDWDHFELRVRGHGPAEQALALKVDADDPHALARCLERLVALADRAR